MRNATKAGRIGSLILLGVFLAGTAYGQRTVTLTLNSATIPDTTRTDSFMEVRGAVNGVSPITLFDGNIIDWNDASTIEPANIGGDYWRVQFQIADTTNLTFKFFSQQAQDSPSTRGWEADPNPTVPPGSGDTTYAVHFFEAENEWKGVSGDRGPYDWRPYTPMEGYVAIWFRVFAQTVEGNIDGYTSNAEAPAQQLGVRGDNLNSGGPLDWGDTKVLLTRESMDPGLAGYGTYSGVGYYPDSLIGQTQAYKFVLDNEILNDGTLGWEDRVPDNVDRTFVIPENDSTLHWVYYGDTAAETDQPVESSIIFNVDMQPLADIGLFSKARGDTVWVFGDFNGWQDCPDTNPDLCQLADVGGTNEFENAFTLSRVPGGGVTYKYFLDFNNAAFCMEFDCVGGVPPSGWEEGHLGGADRQFEFEGGAQQFLDPAFYNDVKPLNVIPDGVSIDVTFSVDMAPADTNDAQPFDAAADSVYLELHDPIWAFTQGDSLFINSGDDDRADILMSDDDQDGVYTYTKTVTGPTYGLITYKYQYGSGGTYFAEPGGGTGPLPGRNRFEVIVPNADGTWPATWDADAAVFQLLGRFDTDVNNVAVEPVGGELPTTVTLARNYPNPFTETTTFEYTVSDRSHVTLSVYNILGQRVATLVDGIQAANTYRVSFDAEKMAAGTYFYRLETPTTVLTRSMVLVK